jgi:hypothetical protein
MSRLALVLAAALAGTGCYSSTQPCVPSASVGWQFRNADGAVTTSCGVAGVTSVDVWSNGVLVGSFPCTASAGVVALAPGANSMEVEGLDGAGTILYRDRLSVGTVGCGAQAPILAEPAEGRLTVSYTFSPVNSCFTPGPSFIWVRVSDDIAGVIAADSAAAPETSNTCGVNFPLSLRLAAGSYTLLSTEEVVRGAAVGTYVPKAANCSHASFPVDAAATTPLSPVLVDTAAFCP